MRIRGLGISVDADRIEWRPTSREGVSWYPLFVAPEVLGAAVTPVGSQTEPHVPPSRAREAAVLIRMSPGRGYPAHRHVGVEDVLIVQGGYRDQQGEHVAGSYLRYEAGSVHAPVALGRGDLPSGPSNPACILFAVAREGIELLQREPS